MSDYSIQVGDTSYEITFPVAGVLPYNCEVDVIRKTKTVSAFGYTSVPVTIVASMPCSIEWKTGNEKKLFDKKTHYMDAVLKCRKPAGVTIVTSDFISYGGLEYEIVDLNDVNNLGVLLKIVIKKVE